MGTIVLPDLLANIVQQLNVKGPLAPFEISEIAFPVFDIGQLAAFDVPTRVGTASQDAFLPTALPVLEDGDFFDGGFDTNPGANTALVDTGQLAAGVHQVHAIVSCTVPARFRFLWRNAADAANLASWSILVRADSPPVVLGPFMCNVALNERFRIDNPNAITGDVASGLIASLNSPSVA